MNAVSAGRGGSADDARLFGAEALPVLRRAAEEIAWLLERGYPQETALRVVGDHHQLHARQRLALQRSTCALSKRTARRSRRVDPRDARGRTVSIDGQNLIVTLEVALSGGLVVRGMDGALRDLAGLRGTYSIIPETDRALDLVGSALKELDVAEARVFLDAPVRSSGKLADLVRTKATTWPCPVEVRLVPDADPVLISEECVVSSDALVLDGAPAWLDLASWILAEHLPHVPVVDLSLA